MQFAYRTLKKGVALVDADPAYAPLPGFDAPQGPTRCSTYSLCGRYYAWATVEGVTVVDTASGNIVTSLTMTQVVDIGFSPHGSYLITFERPSKDENGDAAKNLKVWRTAEDFAEWQEKQVVGQFVQKSQANWNLQYTPDEQYCARAVTNEIQFYESSDLITVWNKLRVEGVTTFAISPGSNNSVAVFIPERKGQPAAVKVFTIPQFASAVSQKTFYKGDKVELKWNVLGTSLIVLAQTETDKSNNSYYGETNLYMLSANGGFDSRITLDKEGPIHDVAWSPNGKEFGVVYGYMPAKTTIFNQRAVATHNFPLGPRNTVIFSPSGRFVLVAGFGNLAGQMDIYDLEKDHRKVCTIEAGNPSVCEWSPDSRYILTATTSPRLRVDNGIRIWHVGGTVMYNEDMQNPEELYAVTWRPQSKDGFPSGDVLASVPTPHASAVAYQGTVKTPSKPVGAYRPPGARGTSTPLHFKREDEGGAAHIVGNGSSSIGANGFGGRSRRHVPGADSAEAGSSAAQGAADGDESLSKAALKNKKKREAKKAKEAEAKASGLAPEAVHGGESRSPDRRERGSSKGGRSHSQRRERRSSNTQRGHNGTPNHNNLSIRPNHPAPAAPAFAIETPELSVTSPGSNSPQAKKLRSLQKKVRAIEDLEMRLAGGEKLEDTQMKKIATKASVQKELDALEKEF